jgi:voltage-gated potassium channel
VARASTEAAAAKIRLAGANRVVQPYFRAGVQLANLVVKPQVAEFLDIVSTAGGPMPELRFEEIQVTPECGLAGKTIGELRIHAATSAMIVAIRRLDGAFEATPGEDARLDEGDVVIGVGTTEEMIRLESLFAAREAPVG